jgi:hypothetical protein
MSEFKVLDPWESYTTKSEKRVVVLDDARRTTFIFDEGMVPNYIVTSPGHFSFRKELPPSDPLYWNLVEVWRVFLNG